jgi:hypothetical protein
VKNTSGRRTRMLGLEQSRTRTAVKWLQTLRCTSHWVLYLLARAGCCLQCCCAGCKLACARALRVQRSIRHKPHTDADCALWLRLCFFRRRGWVTDAELAERQSNASIGLSEGTRNGLAALGEGTADELDEAAELAASGHWREVRRLCMCTAARDPDRAGSPARMFKRAIANVGRCVRVANVRSLHQVLEACSFSRLEAYL